MDERDELTWLVMELTPQGESAAEEGVLASLLMNQSKIPSDHPIFVPCVTYTHKGSRSVLSVMEGYAFLASGLDGASLRSLKGSPWVRRLLTRGSGIHRALETVPDANVRELRHRLGQMVGSEIEEKMKVRVVAGPLLGIVGQVVEVDGNQASVLVEMRSLHAIKDFPRFLLHPVGDDE